MESYSNDNQVILDTEHGNIEVSSPPEKFKKRSAWVAFFLTLLVYGLGHIYSGELRKGIRLLLIYFFCYFSLFGILKFYSNIYTLIILIAFLFPFSIYIYIDAIRTARRKKNIVLHRYNRWYIYTGIFVIVSILKVIPFGYLVPETYGTPTGSMENTVQIGDRLLGNDVYYGLKYPMTDDYFFIYKKPERNDVVYFNFPGYRDEVIPSNPVKYLKRIAGIPGDTIKIADRKVYVNGIERKEPAGIKYLGKPAYNSDDKDSRIFPVNSGWNAENYGPLYVPRLNDVIRLDQDNIDSWITFISREGNQVRTQGVKILINDIEVSEYKIKKDYYFVLGDCRDNALDSRYWGYVPEENILGKITMVFFSWNNNIPLLDFSKRIGSIRWNRIGTIIE